MFELTGDINGIPKIYLVALVACIVIALACFINLYFSRSARDKKLRAFSAALEESLDESRRRLALIEKHAKDYLSEIDSSLRGELDIAKRLIDAADTSVSKASNLLAQGTYAALIEAERVLDTPLNEDRDAVNSVVSATELPGIYPHQIEETVDIIFQRVGEEVAKASSKAKRLGFKPRSRSNTAESLLSAGVRYVNRKRRKASQSFQKPE